MGWGANTLKIWKVGHGFEKVENPWFKLSHLYNKGKGSFLLRDGSNPNEMLNIAVLFEKQ